MEHFEFKFRLYRYHNYHKFGQLFYAFYTMVNVDHIMEQNMDHIMEKNMFLRMLFVNPV